MPLFSRTYSTVIQTEIPPELSEQQVLAFLHHHPNIITQQAFVTGYDRWADSSSSFSSSSSPSEHEGDGGPETDNIARRNRAKPGREGGNTGPNIDAPLHARRADNVDVLDSDDGDNGEEIKQLYRSGPQPGTAAPAHQGNSVHALIRQPRSSAKLNAESKAGDNTTATPKRTAGGPSRISLSSPPSQAHFFSSPLRRPRNRDRARDRARAQSENKDTKRRIKAIKKGSKPPESKTTAMATENSTNHTGAASSFRQDSPQTPKSSDAPSSSLFAASSLTSPSPARPAPPTSLDDANFQRSTPTSLIRSYTVRESIGLLVVPKKWYAKAISFPVHFQNTVDGVISRAVAPGGVVVRAQWSVVRMQSEEKEETEERRDRQHESTPLQHHGSNMIGRDWRGQELGQEVAPHTLATAYSLDSHLAPPPRLSLTFSSTDLAVPIPGSSSSLSLPQQQQRSGSRFDSAQPGTPRLHSRADSYSNSQSHSHFHFHSDPRLHTNLHLPASAGSLSPLPPLPHEAHFQPESRGHPLGQQSHPQSGRQPHYHPLRRPGEKLFLREDVQADCSPLLMWFVAKNMRAAHEEICQKILNSLARRLGARGEEGGGGVDVGEDETTGGQGA